MRTRIKKESIENRNKQIEKMLNLDIKTTEIAKELGCSTREVYKVKNSLKQYDVIRAWQINYYNRMLNEDWIKAPIEVDSVSALEYLEVKESEESLLKKNQRLQDGKNLTNRQIRSINRKDNFYDSLIEHFDRNINIDLSDNSYNTSKQFNNDIDCVIISDTHADEVISLVETGWNEEFNFNIFQKRLRKLEMQIIEHKNRFNNKYLNIFLIWDIISWLIHEELYENGESGKFDVLYKTAIVLAKFINNISNWYKDIYIYTKAWNHGRLSKSIKFKRTDENFDNILYALIKTILKNDKRIKFNLSTSFKDIVKINNFKIWYMHWDLYKADVFVKESQLDLCLQWHYHTANFNTLSRVLTNWAFNKWNWFVAKMLSTWSSEQYQTLFTLKQLDKERNYWLDLIRFFEITKDLDKVKDYGEVLTEKMIFGWNENYEWNIFEQTIGNYR